MARIIPSFRYVPPPQKGKTLIKWRLRALSPASLARLSCFWILHLLAFHHWSRESTTSFSFLISHFSLSVKDICINNIYPAISSYLLIIIISSYLISFLEIHSESYGVSPSITWRYMYIYISMASFCLPKFLYYNHISSPSLLPYLRPSVRLLTSPEESLINPLLDTIVLVHALPLSRIYISHTNSTSAPCLPISCSSPSISEACTSALPIGYFSHLRDEAHLLSVNPRRILGLPASFATGDSRSRSGPALCVRLVRLTTYIRHLCRITRASLSRLLLRQTNSVFWGRCCCGRDSLTNEDI